MSGHHAFFDASNVFPSVPITTGHRLYPNDFDVKTLRQGMPAATTDNTTYHDGASMHVAPYPSVPQYGGMVPIDYYMPMQPSASRIDENTEENRPEEIAHYAPVHVAGHSSNSSLFLPLVAPPAPSDSLLPGYPNQFGEPSFFSYAAPVYSAPPTPIQNFYHAALLPNPQTQDPRFMYSAFEEPEAGPSTAHNWMPMPLDAAGTFPTQAQAYYCTPAPYAICGAAPAGSQVQLVFPSNGVKGKKRASSPRVGMTLLDIVADETSSKLAQKRKYASPFDEGLRKRQKIENDTEHLVDDGTIPQSYQSPSTLLLEFNSTNAIVESSAPQRVGNVRPNKRQREHSPDVASKRAHRDPTRPRCTWPCGLDGCNQVCYSTGDLKRHRQSKKHAVPRHQCVTCAAMFTREDALARHRKSQSACEKYLEKLKKGQEEGKKEESENIEAAEKKDGKEGKAGPQQ